MKTLAIQRYLPVIALLTSMGVASSAQASSLTFQVTNLGTSYSLQQDSSGAVHSVSSGDGTHTYAFEKSPVSYNSNPLGGNWQYQYGTGAEAFQTDHGLQYTVTVASNQAGSVGYGIEAYGYVGQPTTYSAGLTGLNWMVSFDDNLSSIPVRDLNAYGQVVGTKLNFDSEGNPVVTAGQEYTAAFSANDLISHSVPYLAGHDPRVFTSDQLSSYIASDLGVFLSVAVKIDDLGQIIAEGTLDGKQQDFLLTPNGLPTPAPEPTTLALLATGVTALVLRSVRQARKKR